MNKPKFEESEKIKVVGCCEMCGEEISVPKPSEEIWSSYASGLLTVYAICEECEFFENHDGFFDFYSHSGNYKSR